ncbi:LysR family transcriptional regulator [Roseibium suaedae]|uniref:DNA-binding transcriptional regulator, LysR family n=1 Tax=Roseibium suaedae TaxID=735517 RepID=A0A1M7I4S7_9HYPH|nr:LysR family transcriptional regulator [Roseibium suaedae]SHM35639.1 DNA-binding transcriptional regulator, LysR family [Roseibium suaedae]
MIDKLELFMALARERHFGRAAEACNIGQPTLSSAIKQLEDQLGVQLVRRGSRYQGLTPEGEKVLDWARRIVGDYRSMHADIQASRKGLSGNVTIAVIPTALAMVHELTSSFHEVYPDVCFSILSRTSVQILDLIGNLEADFGITYLENEPVPTMVTVPLYLERYLFVTADEALFAGRDRITWAEAGGEQLCLLTPDMQNRRIINRYLTLSGVEPKAGIETDSVLAMVSHIRTGQWSGILPEKLAGVFSEAGSIRTLPLSQPDGTQLVGAIAARAEPRTPVVEALLRHAKQISTIGEAVAGL